MEERIKDKIKEIEKYLFELESIKTSVLEEYRKDIKTKAACERYIEKIAESVVDLAFLIIKHLEFSSPESDIDAIKILSKKSIIPIELSEKLQDLKGMRNIISHEYGVVDDAIVFYSLDEEICRDVTAFLRLIRKLLKA